VAFPTETVYGLGAIAADAVAVEKIFAAKDRPAANPLIVHIADKSQAFPLVREWTPAADKLAEEFWPGPLTLVLPATDMVPSIVRGGGVGVGIRMPAHPVALALISASAPLAAPSANRSGRPSPRTGDEVWEDLAGRITMLLDAGATPGGLESTVLDLTQAAPRIIRPGGVPRQQIEECLGLPVLSSETAGPAAQLPHYRTSSRIIVTTKSELPVLLSQSQGRKIAIVANQDMGNVTQQAGLEIYRLAAAGELFTRLRQAQKDEVELLIIVKDAGIPWDEAMEHRIRTAMQSSGQ